MTHSFMMPHMSPRNPAGNPGQLQQHTSCQGPTSHLHPNCEMVCTHPSQAVRSCSAQVQQVGLTEAARGCRRAGMLI
jgi:hypothetical protein